MISYGQITVSGIEDGYNRAVVQLYMRSSATLVDAPTSHPIYTFSTGGLSFVPTGWSLNVPATDGNPCWVTSATIVSQEATCAVDSWSAPVKLVEDGKGGAAATAYHLILSHAAIVKTKTGAYSPTSITLSAKAQTGSEAMGDYAGRFKIETTTDNSTWTQKYPSSGTGSNRTSYTYTIPSGVVAIRCSLYLAGGLTTLLDQQVVPVVTDGSDGVTITSKSVTYQKGTSGTTAPTGTWQTTVPTVGEGEYLWTKTTVSYSDGTSTEAYSVSRMGTNGANGDSVTITSTEITYQISSSGTVTPTGTWQDTIPSMSPGNYLWTRTIVNYSDGTSTTSYGVSRSGVDGDDAYTVVLTNESHQFQGDTTKAVAASTTIGVIAYKGATQVNTSITNNAITGKPTGMTTTVNNNNSTSTTITVSVTTSMTTTHGTLTIPIVVDGKTFNKVFTYSLQLAPQPGNDATAYHLIVSNAAIVKTKSGAYSPTTITLNAKSQTGTSAMSDYSGRFKIETTANGSTWTQTYPSSGTGSNQSSYTYTIPSGITAIRCSLYLAGGLTTLLDQQVVPVVTDGTDGDPAYTVILTNESHQFAGDTTKAVAGSTTIGVIAYKGATQVATSVTNNSIVTKPTGMTTTVNNNNSTSTTITVSVTTSMVTKNGTLTIPVVVDGKTFNKIFSYSLQLAPEKGEAASSVYMNVSAAAVARSELGAYNPTAITMEAMVQTGVSDPLATTGFFKVETSDGTTWIQRYASSTAESFYSYTNLPTGITSIRISLYKESSMTTLYDQTVIPIVNEGYILTAQQAVHRATAIYGVCNTSATTAAKEVTIADFEAYNGAQITVLFTHEHQAGNPTLNVIGTQTVGAKPIYATSKDGTLTRLAANNPPTSVEERGWIENSLVNFVYDNTNSRWIIVDSSALQKIDNILTKVIAGTHGAINMETGTFTFNGENGSISYDDGDLNITGKINALEGGTIGGFTIGSSSIFKDMSSIIDRTHDGVYLGTDGIALGKGLFKVTAAGKLYSTSAEIGGFDVTDSQIYKLTTVDTNSYKAAINAPSSITTTTKAFFVRVTPTGEDHTYPFYVRYDGKMYAENAEISGTIRATNISLSETGDITSGNSNVGTYTNRVRTVTAGGDIYHLTPSLSQYSTKIITLSAEASFPGTTTITKSCSLRLDPDDFALTGTGGFRIDTSLWKLSDTVSVTSQTAWDVILESKNRGVLLKPKSYGMYVDGYTKLLDYAYSTSNIYTGSTSTGSILEPTFKTSVNDGIAGSVLGSNGNIYLTSDSNPFIRFYANNATTWTQTLTANTNGLEASSSFYATTLYENNVSLANKYAPIPVVKYSESGSQTISDYSMATGTSWTTIGSFTLDKGLNHVIVSCEFASNTTGRRGLCIATSNTGNAMSNNARRYVAPANGANTSVVIDMYISPTANNTTYYLRGYQNSGSALNITTRLTAVNYG